MIDSFKHRLIKLIAVAFGIVAVLSTMIIFLNNDMNDRIEAITANKESLFLRDQRINALSSLSEKIKRADAAMVNLDKILPEKDMLITFPDEVRRMAKEHAVNYTFGFGAEAISEDGKAGHVEFDLSAEGTFENVIAFLKEFEAYPYITQFDDLDMTTFANAPAGNTRQFGIVTGGRIYTK